MSDDRTLGQLVAEASKDVSELVRYEIALAKAEIRADVKRGATAGGMFGAAGYLALLATVVLVISAGLGLSEALPPWLAFLIVAVALLLLAGILGLVGRSQMGKIKPPERTIRTTKEAIAVVRGHGNDEDDLPARSPAS